MVHNGIEYGMMQAFAEGVEIMATSELGIDVVSGLASWRHGSVVRSWLLDLLVEGMERNPTLEGIALWPRTRARGGRSTRRCASASRRR